jgi:2-polyprenyl-6-methoxyphenol hydroxylase-like FAD-dependent oxidoreductase
MAAHSWTRKAIQQPVVSGRASGRGWLRLRPVKHKEGSLLMEHKTPSGPLATQSTANLFVNKAKVNKRTTQ